MLSRTTDPGSDGLPVGRVPLVLWGLLKRAMEEAEERGFWPSQGAVCRSHVLDEFILGQLTEAPGQSSCELCGESPASYIDVDDLRDLVVAVIHHYRRRAIDELYHDPETESGYAIADRHVEDTQDAVSNLFADALDDDLRESVANSLDDDLWFDPGVMRLRGAELYSGELGWLSHAATDD